MNRRLIVALILQMAAVPCFAAAQTTTTTFNVTITILKQCTVTAPASITLGSIGSNDLRTTTTSSTQAYTVFCSKGTPYTIGFSSGNDASNGSALHQMKGTGLNADFIQYNLFDATGGGTIALDAATHIVSDVGTGASQSKSLKAQVVNYSTAVTPDTYTDTVTMTVTY